jgi:hypothetical protein
MQDPVLTLCWRQNGRGRISLNGSNDFQLENGSSQGQNLALTGSSVPNSSPYRWTWDHWVPKMDHCLALPRGRSHTTRRCRGATCPASYITKYTTYTNIKRTFPLCSFDGLTGGSSGEMVYHYHSTELPPFFLGCYGTPPCPLTPFMHPTPLTRPTPLGPVPREFQCCEQTRHI